MADTLTTQSSTLATVPASTVIATDDAGASGHVQIVKLALSADGSATAITADANGLEVQGAGTAGTPAGGVVSVQGVTSGTALPVSGTVAATQSGTWTEANSAAIAASASVLDDWDESDRAKVNPIVGQAGVAAGAGAVGTTTQRVTLASDDPAVTALQVLDNAISGSEMQVDVVAALPAGTNNIGDVDVLTVPADPFGVNADAAATAGSTGSIQAKLRLMTSQLDAIQTSVQLLDNAIAGNELQVDIVSGAGSGGTAATDDAAFTPATTSYTPVGGIVTSDSVDAGDGGAFAMLANRQQKVTLYDSGGVELAVGGGTQYTEDAAAAANPVGNALNLVRDDARAGSLTTADGDNVAARGTNAGELYVKHVDAIPVTDNSGSLTVDGTVTANLAAGTNNIGDVDVLSVVPGTGATNLGKAEDAAHTTGDTGVMALAVRKDSAAASSGTDGDYEPLSTDSTGQLRVNVGNTVTVGSHAVTNAGTFAVQVDGAALTALQLIDDPVATLGTTTYTETSTKGMIVGAVRRDADTTLVDTTNEVGPLQMDANGRLKVEAFSGETLPVSLASVPSHAVTNAGTFAVQVDGAALTALQLIDNPVLVDDAAFTPATSSVMMAGFEADDASTDSVDEGDAGAARMTLDRKVIVQPQPHTTGGLSIFRSIDLDESEEEVKATAGQVYAVWFSNMATSTRFLKFYNATAANVTVGTTTPVITLALPGNTSDDISGVFSTTMGIAFDTAITVAATTGIADNDTGAPAANDVLVNVFYK